MSIKDLRIKFKFIIMVSMAALLPLLVVGYYSNIKSSSALEDRAMDNMRFEMDEMSARIRTFLNTVKQDAIFIETVPPVQGIIRARHNNGFDEQGQSTYQQWVDRLEIIYSNFGKAKPYYLQLRYLNGKGSQTIRSIAGRIHMYFVSTFGQPHLVVSIP